MMPAYPSPPAFHYNGEESVSPHHGEDPLLADFPHMELPECREVDRLLQWNEGSRAGPPFPPPPMMMHMPTIAVYHPHYMPYPPPPPPPPQAYHYYPPPPPPPPQVNSSFPLPPRSNINKQAHMNVTSRASPKRKQTSSEDTGSRKVRRIVHRVQTPPPQQEVLISDSSREESEASEDEESVAVADTTAKPEKSPKPKPSIPELDENGTLHRYRCYQKDTWSKKFNMLLEYIHEHGNCNVPHGYAKNPELAQWVKRQRYQYKLKKEGAKRSTLSDERERRLGEVGFIWNAHRALWMERFAELKSYVHAKGHCNVPSRSYDHPQLSVWIKCQRRQYRLLKDGDPSSNMTQERIDMLDSLGMIWSPRDVQE